MLHTLDRKQLSAAQGTIIVHMVFSFQHDQVSGILCGSSWRDSDTSSCTDSWRGVSQALQDECQKPESICVLVGRSFRNCLLSNV